MSVEVTHDHRHFRAVTETIAVPAVTTTPKVKVRAEATRRKVVVEVRVKAVGARKPAGAITIAVGGRTVQGEVVDGAVRLVLRDLKPGTKKVVVRYAGTDVVQAAVARTTVVVPRGKKS